MADTLKQLSDMNADRGELVAQVQTLDRHRRDLIRQAAKEGHSFADIAAAAKISKGRVSQIVTPSPKP